jgi:hypothetical protein
VLGRWASSALGRLATEKAGWSPQVATPPSRWGGYRRWLGSDAKCRRNYAGSSPITRASGTRRVVLARHTRNKRLADAIYLWAFSAIGSSPGARAFYDHHRAAGDTHHQALRALGNRLAGILHGCLAHHTPYSETTAWAHQPSTPKQQAA